MGLMLKEILAEFRQSPMPLCAADLTAKLAVDSAALEGMLQTLVACGRLIELAGAAGACHTCPVRGGCIVLSYGLPKRYALASSPRGSR
jgi:hypothetical protein